MLLKFNTNDIKGHSVLNYALIVNGKLSSFKFFNKKAFYGSFKNKINSNHKLILPFKFYKMMSDGYLVVVEDDLYLQCESDTQS